MLEKIINSTRDRLTLSRHVVGATLDQRCTGPQHSQEANGLIYRSCNHCELMERKVAERKSTLD